MASGNKVDVIDCDTSLNGNNSEGFIEICHNAELDKDFITKIAINLYHFKNY
jgi:hypothetical protein